MTATIDSPADTRTHEPTHGSPFDAEAGLAGLGTPPARSAAPRTLRGGGVGASATGARRGVITVTGAVGPRYDEILTPEALGFLAMLHDRFDAARDELIAQRQLRRQDIADGTDPDFRASTRPVRDDPDWRVAGSRNAPGLEDRRVEITGPTDPKMTINALNSGARCWLADAEDASSPTWPNVVEGQLALHDAIRGTLTFTSEAGKEYRLRSADIADLPTIVFRPRGWHLDEAHLRYTDKHGITSNALGSLVDFGLYFFHNAAELIARGRGPYFYLPKLEGYREARLWNEVFEAAQDALGIPRGTIRATVLIETLPAAFEMEEILYELRDHCAGLNAGRWDYLFSVIKCFRTRGASYVLPDRGQVTMTAPFMRAYTELLVATCHRRGAHAIGGMSAFIPDRRNPEVTERAFEQVRADKKREATDGFDGTWVAHPDLIPVARAEFDAVLGDAPNQVSRQRDDVVVCQHDLLDIASARRGGATVTSAGLRSNVSVAVRYLDAWLRGTGAAALDNLMEDAATAEISRSQVWQWIASGTVTDDDGQPVTRERVEAVLADVVDSLPDEPGNRIEDAAAVFRRVALRDDFPPFLTGPAYLGHLVDSPVDRP
ncbi:malate synthase A [Promicromonospora citrea]|uniref:Malate synthase n=1 Tax=Promicromonospora citrea TaxID=43677 RepID=A0A8H9GEA0_9MICO|nr:malate synthase A [Promicromonospora citrea]NNH50902.1 malate synthase A [Promicromonospora citrea]GGM15186.1 malate synthase [Promicromonospora citrea]